MTWDVEKALSILACPACRADLKYQAKGEGLFTCPSCAKSYPVIKGIPRFLEVEDDLLGQAKDHWEASPSFQYEASYQLYSREYYEEQDRWRAEDIDPFIMHEYRFPQTKGQDILDIGCGSGWVIKQAAKAGAFAVGVDFAEKACLSSRGALDTYGLDGLVVQADAQRLPIKTDVIDRVFSMGVLHHIPDTEKGVAEAYRVLKPGGTALISLYGKLFFFNPVLFPVAQFFLKRLLKAPEARDGIQHTQDFDTFYKFMDGPTNPIGRWYTDQELVAMFSSFKIHNRFTSHFPLRYLKLGGLSLSRITPRWLHRFMDIRLGMMRHFQMSK